MRPVFEVPMQLNLDGTTCYMNAEGALADLPLGNEPYTIELSFQPLGTSLACCATLLSWGEPGVGSGWQAIQMMSYTTMRNAWWGDDLTTPELSPLNDGLWHHVVATYDGNTRTLYVDGQFQASKEGTRPDGKLISNDNFCIGAGIGSSPSYEFVGNIKDVKIWDTTFPAEAALPSC